MYKKELNGGMMGAYHPFSSITTFKLFQMVFFWSSCSFTSSLIILQLLLSGTLFANGCYTSIINFGDSVSDTGNMKHLATLLHKFYGFLQPPFGETFFHKSTGRCSNGRLIIDFLAESLNLSFIPPFLENNNVAALGQGVNYAVVGATALDSSFLEARGVFTTTIDADLGVQLAWFKQSLASICSNVSGCRNLIGRSLIMMGEIGGGDYNTIILYGTNDAESYISVVVDTIISAVNELIDMGAQTLVVPGIFPIGCSSSYLTDRGSGNQQDYDNTTGCLIRYNKLVENHNQLLQTKLNKLRELHPSVIIIYADYYNAAMQIIRSPDKFGFTNWALKSCCGGGGVYNYNRSVGCGLPAASVCDDPDTYVYWDGIHFTEAAYKIIFKSLFQGPYTTPQFNSLCPTTSSVVKIDI